MSIAGLGKGYTKFDIFSLSVEHDMELNPDKIDKHMQIVHAGQGCLVAAMCSNGAELGTQVPNNSVPTTGPSEAK